jgi:NAD(P)-dependent dehydrogenase (short-subunit alcohol dehydrogenase family)
VAISRKKNNSRVVAVKADVTKSDEIQELVGKAVSNFGGVDILVNNAGRAQLGNFEKLTDDAWKEDLEVKLFSMIRCSRSVIPFMLRQKWGRIININAVFGKMPDPTFFATSTNRAACIAFTKSLATEIAQHNVLVNSVNIGFVETSQWENIHRQRAPNVSKHDFFGQLAQKYVPLGRFGRADEVSGIVAFLASPRASYITGTSVDVSGGMGSYL